MKMQVIMAISLICQLSSFECYNSFANMEQFPAKDPPLPSMLNWLNTLITPCLPPVTTLEQLTDGTIFLTLLSKVCPEMIEATTEAQDNAKTSSSFLILFAALNKMGLQFVDVKVFTQPAIGNSKGIPTQHIMALLAFLYTNFAKPQPFSHKQQIAVVGKKKKHIKLKYKDQASNNQSLSTQVSPEESFSNKNMSELQRLEKQLKEIELIVDSSMNVTSKVKTITQVVQGKVNVEMEEKNTIYHRQFLSFYHFTQQDLELIAKRKHEDKRQKCSKKIQVPRQRYFADKKKLDSFDLKYNNSEIFHLVGRMTSQILKIISSKTLFTPQQETIVGNFSKILGIVQSFNYLFFGSQPSQHMFRVYNFTQNEESFKIARKDLQRYCQNYYKSVTFIKRLLSSHKTLMRNKMIIIFNLANIQKFPTEPIQDIGILTKRSKGLRFTFKRADQDYTIIHSHQTSQIRSKSSRPKNNSDILQIERTIINEYWSKHRMVLIAYEVRHIYNKKPNFEDEQSYKQFINSDVHERFEFDGGFLFPGKKYKISIDFMKIVAESEKYPHLKSLLVQDEISLHHEDIRLRNFVQIMLQLKHHSIVKDFLDIYEIIVGEVTGVSFGKVRYPTDKLIFLTQVEEKLKDGVQRINDYFTSAYNMPDDRKEIAKLLKVSAYCFLAEYFSFPVNQYYKATFEMPEVDKKETTSMSSHVIFKSKLE